MKERDKRFEEEEEEKGSGGGGGNKNAIAYGLLAQAGYNTRGMSPAEAWELVDRLNLMWKRTDEDKKGIKEKNEKFESEGGLSDDIHKKAKEVIETMSFHNVGNKTEIKNSLDAIYDASKKYSLNKMSKVDTANLGPNVLAKANGTEMTINERLLRNPSQAYRSCVDGWKKDAAKSALGLGNKKDKKTVDKAEELAKFERGNVIYKGDEVRSTIMHEMGHVVADQLFGQINGDMYMKGGINAVEAKRKRKVIEDAYDEAKASGDIYKISCYAANNSHEFFAECFAIKQMGKEKLPEKIEKAMEEVLK